MEFTDQHYPARQNDHVYGDPSDRGEYDGSRTFLKDIRSWENGLQSTDDSVTRLKNELAANDPNVIFTYIPFQDDDTERPAEVCSLGMFLLQNVNANDKVIVIAETRHTQRWSERELDPMLCEGGLAFFCNCLVTLGNLRLWAHARTLCIPHEVGDLETVEFADVLGAIAEEQHLTRCAQVCFTGTEVLGDQDMEEGGDVLDDADQEAHLLEQIPLPGHPESEKERLASWLRLPRRARVAIRRLHRNLRHLPREALVRVLRAARAPQDFQRCHDLSVPRMRQHKAETSNTKCHRLDLVLSITKWESVCSRSLTQSACASGS